MILRDASIRRMVERGKLGITPYSEHNVQPSSVDLTLGGEFKMMREHPQRAGQSHHLDPFEDEERRFSLVNVAPGDFYLLRPGTFALATTVERITLPPDLVGRLDGKSSLARLGLVVHSTAGFFDPGFNGTCTLEFSTVAPRPIRLYPGMKIAQMSFHLMDGEAVYPYGSRTLGSKYMGQEGATESRYHENARV